MRGHLSIIFDGVDTKHLLFVGQSDRVHALNLQSGGMQASIPEDVPLVTYVTRCFEPYRGWPQVAQGLSLLMQRNPRAHVLLVGSDEVAYGAKRGDGISWREWALMNGLWTQADCTSCLLLGTTITKSVINVKLGYVYWTVSSS